MGAGRSGWVYKKNTDSCLYIIRVYDKIENWS